MYRSFYHLATRGIIAILLASSSACSLLFEQAPAVDGGVDIVDAATPPVVDANTVDAATPLTIDRRVSEDSEEVDGTGTVDTENRTLRINVGAVALEFGAIEIPQGAKILDASIVFRSQEARQEVISVEVVIDEAVPVAALTGNSGDISNRSLDLSVSWTPGDWDIDLAGPAQTTPSLIDQVQRNTCNAAWMPGQSLVFVILPGLDPGRRPAYSLDGSKSLAGDDSLAPRLSIRYQPGESVNCQ